MMWSVHRARFELLCSSLFNKSIQPIRSVLAEAGLSTSDINKVSHVTSNIHL